MKSLVDKLNNRVEVNQQLIEEYYTKNECKKSDEKWIKENRLKVIEELNKLGKDKCDYGDYRVEMVIPDTSKFDEEKLLSYLDQKGLKGKVVKEVLDEGKLSELIENEIIDVSDLQEVAWVESEGSPRITVKKLNRE